MDRASGYGPEGHGFESSSARQNKKFTFVVSFLFFGDKMKGIRKARFDDSRIATFRGTVAKSVGLVVGVAAERIRPRKVKTTVRSIVDFIFSPFRTQLNILLQ